MYSIYNVTKNSKQSTDPTVAERELEKKLFQKNVNFQATTAAEKVFKFFKCCTFEHEVQTFYEYLMLTLFVEVLFSSVRRYFSEAMLQ